jgi:NAD(P)-dependent dehydrogenase (short-subunit alcohol dehydrogenase family)
MDKDYLASLFGIEGKVAFITGAGGVLFSNIALALAKAGARVVVADLAEDAAQAVAARIAAAGGETLAVKVDVLSRASVEAALAATLQRFGSVDILINGAGGNKKDATTSRDLSFFDLPEAAFRWVFDLNLMGTVIPCQVIGRQMASQKSGIILNVASMTAIRPLTNVVAYGAAKAGVVNFTQWLATHMSQNYCADIRVNAIAPGFLLTQQNHYLLVDEQTGEWTERGKTILSHTPMGRMGDPDSDLLGTVLWLVSPAARFVHGAVIPIDGGFAACSGV